MTGIENTVALETVRCLTARASQPRSHDLSWDRGNMLVIGGMENYKLSGKCMEGYSREILSHPFLCVCALVFLVEYALHQKKTHQLPSTHRSSALLDSVDN